MPVAALPVAFSEKLVVATGLTPIGDSKRRSTSTMDDNICRISLLGRLSATSRWTKYWIQYHTRTGMFFHQPPISITGCPLIFDRREFNPARSNIIYKQSQQATQTIHY
eukprot:9498121-Pyramimonas_sp.AAC.1